MRGLVESAPTSGEPESLYCFPHADHGRLGNGAGSVEDVRNGAGGYACAPRYVDHLRTGLSCARDALPAEDVRLAMARTGSRSRAGNVRGQQTGEP